jgi:hypothetical protein
MASSRPSGSSVTTPLAWTKAPVEDRPTTVPLSWRPGPSLSNRRPAKPMLWQEVASTINARTSPPRMSTLAICPAISMAYTLLPLLPTLLTL